MNIQEILETLKPIDQLWDLGLVSDATHLVESVQSLLSGVEAMDLVESIPAALSSWHGYGWRTETTGLVVSPFTDDPNDIDAITALMKRLLPPEVTVNPLVMPRFRQIGSGEPSELDSPFQPGNVIIRDCSSANNGTIGAFLSAEDGSTWLISNRHVLDQCPSSKVLGSGRTELGTDVRFVQFQDTGNVVDAGVVRIENRSQIDPHFEELGTVKQLALQTLAELQNDTPVKKFGNFTKLTSGRLSLHCSKVKIAGLDGVDREFVDQFAIVSDGSNGAFAMGGDSGSLVVGNEQPLGLLFAMSDEVVAEVPKDQDPKPPFYLANRWDNVIQKLEDKGIVGSPLKLMLTKEEAAGTH